MELLSFYLFCDILSWGERPEKFTIQGTRLGVSEEETGRRKSAAVNG